MAAADLKNVKNEMLIFMRPVLLWNF